MSLLLCCLEPVYLLGRCPSSHPCPGKTRSGCSGSCISAVLLRGAKGQGNHWVCAQPPSSLRLSALLCFTLQGLVPLISACTSHKVPCGRRSWMLSRLVLLWSPEREQRGSALRYTAMSFILLSPLQRSLSQGLLQPPSPPQPPTLFGLCSVRGCKILFSLLQALADLLCRAPTASQCPVISAGRPQITHFCLLSGLVEIQPRSFFCSHGVRGTTLDGTFSFCRIQRSQTALCQL